MLHNVVLCCAMLCYPVLCCTMLYHVEQRLLCCAMLCYVALCCGMLCNVVPSWAMFCYVVLCFAMLCYVLLCWATVKTLVLEPRFFQVGLNRKRKQRAVTNITIRLRMVYLTWRFVCYNIHPQKWRLQNMTRFKKTKTKAKYC